MGGDGQAHPFVVDQVERARVGDVGDGQAGDPAEGLLVVQRRAEHPAGLGQEPLADGGLVLGRVVAGPVEGLARLLADGVEEAGVVVGERPRLGPAQGQGAHRLGPGRHGHDGEGLIAGGDALQPRVELVPLGHRGHEHDAAGPQGVGGRQVGLEGEGAEALHRHLVVADRADDLHGATVLGQQAQGDAGRARPVARPVHDDAGHLVGGAGLGQLGGDRLQIGQPAGRLLGCGPGVALGLEQAGQLGLRPRPHGSVVGQCVPGRLR